MRRAERGRDGPGLIVDADLRAFGPDETLLSAHAIVDRGDVVRKTQPSECTKSEGVLTGSAAASPSNERQQNQLTSAISSLHAARALRSASAE